MNQPKKLTNVKNAIILSLALFGATISQAAAYPERTPTGRQQPLDFTIERPASSHGQRAHNSISSSRSASPESLGLDAPDIIKQIKDPQISVQNIIDGITATITDLTILFDVTDANGATPLIIAAEYNPAKIEFFVEILREHCPAQDLSARLNDFDNDGNTAIMALLHNKALDNESIAQIIEILIDAGANPDQSNFKHFYPLHTAISLGKDRVAKKLLEKGAKPSYIDGHGFTPLNTAVAAGSFDLIEALLNNNPPADKTDLQRAEPAFKAAHDGNLEMVKTLVKTYSFPLDQQNQYGTTIIDAAAASGRVAVVDYLGTQYPVFTPPTITSALVHAAGNDQLEMVQHLIDDYFGNPLEEDRTGTCALMHAAACNAAQVCKYFLDFIDADPLAESVHTSSVPDEHIPEMLWHACNNNAAQATEVILAARPYAIDLALKKWSEEEQEEITPLQAAKRAALQSTQQPTAATILKKWSIRQSQINTQNCHDCSPRMGMTGSKQKLEIFDCCGGTACIKHFNHLSINAAAQCPYCQSYDFGRPNTHEDNLATHSAW